MRIVESMTIAAAIVAATAVRAEAAPPTLTGEVLEGVPQIVATCNPDGVSTVTWETSGTATGPYAGTFTESGVATVGQQSWDVTETNITVAGPLLTLEATFEIQSAAGAVTGTKTLVLPIVDPAIQSAMGTCAVVQGVPGVEAVGLVPLYTVHYEALVTTPEGLFTDRGVDPGVSVQRVRAMYDPPWLMYESFFEDFTSDLTEPEPLNTPGLATGGGQIPGDVTFGFAAKSDGVDVKGNCTVVDRATATAVKCLDAASYYQTATHASFAGTATVNGAATTYRISIDDVAEPGIGADTFTITTASGYSASGVLARGNVQVHR